MNSVTSGSEGAQMGNNMDKRLEYLVYGRRRETSFLIPLLFSGPDADVGVIDVVLTSHL